MKAIIGVAFLAILGALGAALLFMVRDRSKTNRMVNALTLRISLSVLLLLFIWFSWWMGWLHPRAY